MKKNYFKKSLSLIMTVLMIMSCWVFVAPTEAEAATLDVSFPMTLNYTINTRDLSNGGNIIVKYYKFNTDGTLDKTTSYDYIWVSSLSATGYGNTGSHTITTQNANQAEYQMPGIPGWPYEISIEVVSTGQVIKNNRGKLYLESFYVGGINVLNGWVGTTNSETRTWRSGMVLDNITMNWPEPTWNMSGQGNASVQVPTYGSRTSGTVSAKITDANGYGVSWPTISYSITGTNVTLNQSNNAASVTVTNKALINFTSGSGTANLTLTASGAGKTSTSTVTLNAPKKDILYENLFSLSDWYYSESSRYTDPYVITDPNAGTIKIYKPSDVGEYTTVSSYPSNHDASRYSMSVVGGKEYLVEFTTSNSTNATDANNISEIFLFWYDANGTPVNNVAGSATFNNQRFTGNGKHSVTFTAPASATQAEIRFDNDTSGSVSNLTFSNISIVEKERADAVDLANWPTRPASKAYTYKATLGSTLAVPSRIGHNFAGWYLDNNSNGINDAGDTAVTDGNGTVVTGLQMDNNYILRADWTKIPYDIGYDNLFSVAEWSKTGSKNPNSTANGTVTYDVDAGTITAESVANGEVYSIYGGAGDVYHINVEPETSYIFEADMDLVTGDRGQMFVFFYDANGNGLTGANNGAITQPHIGIYLTNEGANSIKFKTPANCTKMGVRFGATTVGTKATYSDIKFMKQDVYDAYAKNYPEVREPYYYGDTTELSDPPERDGYKFNGWVDGEGNVITSVSGMHESDTVYATWVKKYKITFLNAAGGVFHTAEVISGNKLTALPTSSPSKDSDDSYSYNFDKWMYNGAEFTTSTEITGDITVTPSFKSQAHGDFIYAMVAGCTEATCEENAKVRKTCGKCSYNFGIVPYDGNDQTSGFLALGHEYDETAVVIDPSNGDKHEICCVRYTECGSTTYVDHVWSYTETTGATCSVKGTVHYTCPCQATKTEEGALAPDVHVNTEKVNYVEPTCLVAGKDYDTYCNDCNTTVATGASIKELGHSFTNYVLDGDATCTVDGHETAKCDRCDVTDTRVAIGSALGHDWTETAEAAYLKSAADCENDAVYYYACSRCDASSKDDDASTWTNAGTASGHDYTGATARNNNNGTHSYICKNGCNTYGYDRVKDAAKDCTYGEWDTTAATEHKKTCTECGYVYTQAHDWSKWDTADGATAEAPAQQTRSCGICGKVETKDCTYTSTHEDATCTSPERTTYSCSECGHGYTVIGDPAKGHNFTSGTYKHNATSDTHQQLCVNGCGLYGVGTTANAMEPCSWTYKNDSDGKHIASCVCGNSQREACTGGTATCTEPKTCEKCNTYYGDKADHSFTGDPVVLEGDKHAFRCVYCNDQTIYGIGANKDYTVDCSGGTATCSAAAECTVCGDPHGDIDEDNHKWITPPTNNEGTETHTYTCSYNSAHTKDEDCFCSSPAVVAPDCEAAGYQQNYCDDCGHGWQSAQVDALGHKWGNWVNNNDGTHTRTCVREGCTYNSGTAKTETASCTKENAKADVTDPTCLEKGYTTYTCNECGYVWVDDEVAATGHSYLDKVKKTDSIYKRSGLSCTTALTYWYACDNCDVSAGTETDKYDDITLLYWTHTEPTDHNFSKKVVDAKYLKAEATCTESAVYYYSCANVNCGASSEGTASERTFTNGAPLGHAWENTEKYLKSEADCVNNEVYYKECSRCHISSEGETDATWTKENTMTGHDFDHDDDDAIGNEGDAGYVAKKDPTCSEDGNPEYYLCQVCGKKYADKDATTELSKVVLDSLGHSWVSVPYKAATCVEDGYTSHKACSRCNEKNEDYQVYPMIGHNFSGAYYYDKIYNYHAKYCVNENCTTYGLDGVEYKVEYDGLDYTFVGGEACVFDKFTASTNEAGEHSHNLECVCGNAQNVTIGTENIKTEVVDPTCTEAGYTLNTCQKDDCGMTWKTDIVEKLGHDLTGDATSNGNGTHSVKCARCGYSADAEKCSTETPSTTCGSKNKCDVCHGEFGEAIAHVFTNYVYNNDATCTADGTKTAECDNCDINATDTVTAPGTKLGHAMTAYGYDIKDWQFKPDDFNVEIKEPTCGAEGRSISYCTRCSHYLTKVVPKDGSNHKMPEEWTVVGGNCASGVTYVRACTVCGKKESKTENIPHEWKAVVIEEAGCTVNGYIDFECKVCGFVATLNDSVDTWPSFDGVDYSDKKIVATGKHSWQTEAPADEDYMMIEGVVVFVEAYPTYNTTGRGYKKCTICNVVEKVIIEAYGNDPANHKHPELGINDNSTLKYVAEVKPTCTVGGHKGYYECTRCSYSQYVLNHDAYYLAALGHADKNADGKCDTCKTKLEEDAASKNCGCICHKNSGFMKFIYMILKFFWKLFGMNKTCACGVAHY